MEDSLTELKLLFLVEKLQNKIKFKVSAGARPNGSAFTYSVPALTYCEPASAFL